MSSPPVFEFDSFRLDTYQRLLFRNGRAIPLDPQAFEVLRVLVQHNLENPGTIISKHDLLNQAWEDDASPSDETLAFHIHSLRDALGDDPHHPSYIETIRKRGLRFLPKVKAPLSITEADRLFQTGRYLWHRSTPESVHKAILYFEQTVALDKSYGAAYAGIAESWVLLGTFGHQTTPAPVAMPKAQEAALRALEINDTIAEAHSALASVEALYHWNWANAQQEFQKAIALTENPMVNAWYVLGLAARKEWQQARMVIQEAINRLAAPFLLTALSGRVYYLARDYEQAILTCQQGIDLEPFFYLNHLFLGHTLRACERYTEALAAFEKAKQFNDGPVVLAEFGHLWGLQGERQKSLDVICHLEQIAQHRYISPHVFAHIYLGLGETEKAFEFLEKTFEERGAYLIFLDTDSLYDPLRKDARFSDLVRRVGFSA